MDNYFLLLYLYKIPEKILSASKMSLFVDPQDLILPLLKAAEGFQRNFRLATVINFTEC